MIIRKAKFKKLHGHMDLELSFKPGVNIVIGVNGSGKTSVLNAMSWVLSPAAVQDGLPAAYLLSNLKFDEIDIAYSIPGQRKYQHVTAERSQETIIIKLPEIEEALEIPIIGSVDLRRLATDRAVHEPADLITRMLEDQRDNLVLAHLSGLPGPLYLPLNRRWTEERELRYPRGQGMRRSTAAGHLPISEVLSLADRVFREEQSETFASNEALRRDIITSLFETGERLAYRRVWTSNEVKDNRSRVIAALGNLGLRDAVHLSEKYFNRLDEFSVELGGESFPKSFPNAPKSETWVSWLVEASPMMERIERLLPLIEKYETDRLRITRRSRAFLDAVNKFVRDNKKELQFSRVGDLSAKLPGGQHIDSRNLSSGEMQLLILFAFLCFEFEAEQEFPVFVDEPELSLHVAWQNRYVNSIQEANPKAQFIVATHSPEIAAPAQDRIIDLSPKRKSLASV